LQTVTLKATPAAVTPKAPGGAKGSWGKPGTKAPAAGAGAGAGSAAPAAKAAGADSDVKVYRSDGDHGFEIPVKTKMFDVEPI
jgi:hypothetical protein